MVDWLGRADSDTFRQLPARAQSREEAKRAAEHEDRNQREDAAPAASDVTAGHMDNRSSLLMLEENDSLVFSVCVKELNMYVKIQKLMLFSM